MSSLFDCVFLRETSNTEEFIEAESQEAAEAKVIARLADPIIPPFLMKRGHPLPKPPYRTMLVRAAPEEKASTRVPRVWEHNQLSTNGGHQGPPYGRCKSKRSDE